MNDKPIPCECGFYNRNRPHSRVGGGPCLRGVTGKIMAELSQPDEDILIRLQRFLDNHSLPRDEHDAIYDACYEIESLGHELVRYKRHATQRAARMQILRRLLCLAMATEDYSSLDEVWESVIMQHPEAERWFDKDGVPVDD